jgi:hypothetical protein
MKLNFQTRGRSLMAVISLLIASATMSMAASQTYYFYVFSSPTEGMEDRYNTWYNVQHGPDVVAVPDFVTAQRFVINDEQLNDASLKLPKYVVVYKIVTEDLAAVNKEVSRRLAAHETIIDPSFGKGGVSYTYKNIGPEVKGAGEPAGAKAGQEQTYLQFIFSQPVDGKEDEFNAWYDKTYVPALAGTRGFVAAQRMIVERPATRGVPSTKYLSMLTIRTADISAVLKTAAKKYSQSVAAVDATNTRAYTYRAIGPVILGDDVRAYRLSARAVRQEAAAK